MSVEAHSSSSHRKRGREEDEWAGELDAGEMDGTAPKRARLEDNMNDEIGEDVGGVAGAVEDDFDPLGLGRDMGEVMEEKRKAVAVEGDTSGWTLRQLITKRVVGQESGLGDGEGGNGRRQAGELVLPSVRSTSGRSAVMAPVVDVDPALGFYEAPSLQVRIGEDGRVVLDTASAIVQQQPEADLGPRREIQGGRTHITSATYAKHERSERWTDEDVEVLYEALSKCGTDFSMIEVFFPTRTRAHIKARFKKEEKINPDRVNAALKARVPMDIEELKELIAIKKQAAQGNAKASASAQRSKSSSKRPSAAPSGAQSPDGTKTPAQIDEPKDQALEPDDDFDVKEPEIQTQPKTRNAPEKATPASPEAPIPAPRPLSPVEKNESPPPSPGAFDTSALNYDDLN